MHTFVTKDGTRFHYNTDLSGNVVIRRKDGEELELSGETLIEFMAAWVYKQQLFAYEKRSSRAILGLEDPLR